MRTPKRAPDLVLTRDDGSVYLKRWWMIPRNRFLNVYFHEFLGSDEDRALHDHPWWFVSILLQGSYWEHLKGGLVVLRTVPSVVLRRADTAHRVELPCETMRLVSGRTARYLPDREIPAYTLVFTGPKIRSWGFWCPQGWVHWRRFDMRNGCGER